MKYLISSILFFFISQSLLSKDWNISMYFKIENTKKIAINKNEEYVQFSATANWEDSFGDFGILDCMWSRAGMGKRPHWGSQSNGLGLPTRSALKGL